MVGLVGSWDLRVTGTTETEPRSEQISPIRYEIARDNACFKRVTFACQIGRASLAAEARKVRL